MVVLQPRTWHEALEIKAAHPDAVPIAGGTDLMVEINFDRRRPEAVLDLTTVPELSDWAPENGHLRIGAGITYTRLVTELSDKLPGLGIASRTIGSPQIRNRATVGGNLATASPAGDALPPLFASDAVVSVASTRGVRRLPVAEFIVGPKRNALASDELIADFVLPVASGPQQFSKVGTRNAMVIAVCSLALSLWPEQRRLSACIGSAGPTPIRATAAEEFIAAELDWDARAPLPDGVARKFGALVEGAARPIDDVRGTARYRHHALGVLAVRSLRWAWEEHRCA